MFPNEIIQVNEKKLRNYEVVADKHGLPYQFKEVERVTGEGTGKEIKRYVVIAERQTREAMSYSQLTTKYKTSLQNLQKIIGRYLHEVYALADKFEKKEPQLPEIKDDNVTIQ